MKKINLISFALVGIIAITFFSCQKKDNAAVVNTDEISATTKSQIKALGFSADEARKVDGGYLVEGDILLTEDNLSGKTDNKLLSIAETEQYRTTNVVTGLPRVITVSVSNLPTVYTTAVSTMITRYNALGLLITFQLVSTNGNIKVVGFNQGPSGGYITLGSSGFPTSSGNPYSQIMMNTNAAAYGTNPNVLYLASVLQHEVGHCIGFRHTDYANRAYSCGGTAVNEGASTVGAIHIPGTPTGADAASFMLACSNGGNRTFNANDIIALNYLY